MKWKAFPVWGGAAGQCVTQDEDNQTKQEQELEPEVKKGLLLMTWLINKWSKKIRKEVKNDE